MAGRGRKWWWRWRSNALRRREDVLEAWLVPAVRVLVAVDDFAQRRSDRTPVRAVLIRDRGLGR
ncbi:hypothetical protein ACIP2Y_16160 [Streptomyces sviceus]|uniref:hypothetical protein n=1 Tax=Streptomyces sviceus TaxID=285530 RepID=UPI003822C7AF